MKNKYFAALPLMVFAIFSFLWQSVSAQSYEIDEATPLITVVSPTGTTQLTSNCTWIVTDTANDNNLPENNREYYSRGDYLGTLIDNNLSTYWHSSTSMNLHNEDEYIQVDLMRDDIQRFFLYLYRREDVYKGEVRYGAMPTKMDIKATNTPDDESSWIQIVNITGAPTAGDDGVWPYTKLIELGAPYRYVRVYCRESVGTNNSVQNYWCPAELQFYAAKEIADYHSVLMSVLDSVFDLNINFKVGTELGCVNADTLDAYYGVLEEAQILVSDESADNASLKAMITRVRQSLASVFASVPKVESGYYRIVSGDTLFMSNFGKDFVAYSNGSELRYKAIDSIDTKQIFYIEKLDSGKYTMQCIYDKKYAGINTGDNYYSSTSVPMRDTISTYQLINALGNGYYSISTTDNELPYFVISANEGQTSDGIIGPSSASGGIECYWMFQHLDNEEAENLLTTQILKDSVKTLLNAVREARALCLEMKLPEGLLKTASQLSSNCTWKSYVPAFVIDGDHNTYFHSSTSMSLFTDDEYMQMDLGRDDVTKFYLEYWGRNDGATVSGASWHDSPNSITISGTNTPDVESSWVDIRFINGGFPGNVDNGHYVSPLITVETPYRYLRMHVKNATSNQSYWNVSELQVYDKSSAANDTSTYTLVPQLREFVDKIETALDTLDEHCYNLTFDGNELEGISDWVDSIKMHLSNLDSVEAALNEASATYNKLFVIENNGGLITTVNNNGDGTTQLTSNCTWMSITPDNDNYSFNQEFIDDNYNLLGALIDNNDQTYWHSDPNSDYRSTEQYIQIDLQGNYDNLRLVIDRRNDLYQGSNRHGAFASEAMLYGTNDESVLDSACSSWTMLHTFTGIPSVENGDSWPYIANVSLDQPYRYLRFRPTNSHGGTFWCMSGFQIYDNDAEVVYDEANSQYFYVDGMKEAADNLKAVIDEVSVKLSNKQATLDDAKALRDAAAAVEALWIDHDLFTEWYDKVSNLYEYVTVGDEFGDVQSQEAVDNLETAVGLSQDGVTNTAVFNNLVQQLKDAYEGIQDAVIGVEEGTWYYIKSTVPEGTSIPADGYYNKAREDAHGAAIYILSDGGSSRKGDVEGNYFSGQQMRWGMDDIKNKETDGDIDALWRVIPVPDSVYGKRVYNIQNMRTGWYLGTSSSSDYYTSSSSRPIAYNIEYIGAREFALNLVDTLAPHKGAVGINYNARQVRLDVGDAYVDSVTSFTFEALDPDEFSQVTEAFHNNSMYIVTFPFDFVNLNDEAQTYAICNKVSDTQIGLVSKTEFKAGEPFIMVLGDTTLHETDDSFFDIVFDLPTDLVMKADTVNGLIGTLDNTSVNGAGYGYFTTSGLFQVTGEGTTSFEAQRGYINADLITDLGVEPDVIVTVSGEGVLNKIENAVAVTSETVNVYTVDGVLVKHNVKASEATNGLAKGIYIIGKKKVLVDK